MRSSVWQLVSAQSRNGHSPLRSLRKCATHPRLIENDFRQAVVRTVAWNRQVENDFQQHGPDRAAMERCPYVVAGLHLRTVHRRRLHALLVVRSAIATVPHVAERRTRLPTRSVAEHPMSAGHVHLRCQKCRSQPGARTATLFGRTGSQRGCDLGRADRQRSRRAGCVRLDRGGALGPHEPAGAPTS